MTYHRLFHPGLSKYFAGESVRNHHWVSETAQALILPTQDANNIKRYFKKVSGKELQLEPVLPSELQEKATAGKTTDQNLFVPPYQLFCVKHPQSTSRQREAYAELQDMINYHLRKGLVESSNSQVVHKNYTITAIRFAQVDVLGLDMYDPTVVGKVYKVFIYFKPLQNI